MRIQFDFYHVQIVGGDLIRRFEKHLPVVGHVQIAAVPSRHEPDEGEINYPAMFEAVDRLGYGNWIGCEYRPRAQHRGRARLGAQLRRGAARAIVRIMDVKVRFLTGLGRYPTLPAPRAHRIVHIVDLSIVRSGMKSFSGLSRREATLALLAASSAASRRAGE